ncbi:transcriptional regulator [Pedobacter sp. BAL39]|uniref:LacI family DNA-binding transcriptional regulator n=1 Tax=Pedobacter sp. BAL39 TaxID=391596 RepID=UPI000155A293|nr:substrate-binding domain-containing protein [Pedobacter sp. BAL39]EDM34652.1 transcriptional regulator [Pedobacter sp. BAL39]
MKKEQETTKGIKEIARLAKVSIGTVDRVINNRTGVSVKTKEKVLQIIAELDYQPNIMARMLASKKVIRIAALIPAVSNETGYWNAPLKGINEAASEIRNFGVSADFYFFDQNNKKTFRDQCAVILDNGYDGILLAPMFEEEAMDFLDNCAKRDLPFVLINSDLEHQPRVAYIGPDLFQSGYLAGHLTKYLVKEAQQVLIVNISREITFQHHLLKKEEGFRACLAAHDLSIEVGKVDINETSYDAVQQRLLELFDLNKPDLVFVTNSRVSSVARFLQENAIEGVQLIGYDFLEENIAYLKNGTIDFLICQKPQEQGYRGLMSLYQHLISAPTVEQLQYMPIDIITKENYLYYRN